MPDRCTRDTVTQPVPDMQSFQGAFAKGGIVDIAFGICATDAELLNNVLRFFIFLNRHGPALQHFQGTVDPAAYRIEINKEIEYDPDEALAAKGGRGKKREKLPELPNEFET